jgi:hypothetical protein
MKITAFWDVRSSSHHFAGTCCLQLWAKEFYEATQYHIPEDSNVQCMKSLFKILFRDNKFESFYAVITEMTIKTEYQMEGNPD